MSKLFQKISVSLFLLLVFAFPFEHKYDKPLRHLSKALYHTSIQFPRSFDKKIYFYASDLIALFLFAALLFAFRIPLRRLLSEKGAPLLWIIFFCSLTSLFFSPLSDYPVVYTRLLQLLTPILLFSFLASGMQNKAQLIFSTLVASALFQSAIAIAQYFTQSPLGLEILSEPKSATGMFSMQDGWRWVFDRWENRIASTSLMRASGTMPHCNMLGGFMMSSLLATYSLIIFVSKNWLRILLGLSLTIQLFTLSITYSRSALFGWLIGTLVWFGYTIYHRGIKSLTSSPFRTLACMIAIAAATNVALLSDQYLNRGGIVNYNLTAQGSDLVRLDAQAVALKIIQDHPLIGVGYQQYNKGASVHLPPGERPMGVHNIYLFLAAETGLVSLAALLAFLGLIFIAALRAPSSPQLASLLSIFVAFLFIGMCDYYLILFHQGKIMLFTIAGLLAAEGIFSGKRTPLEREKLPCP